MSDRAGGPAAEEADVRQAGDGAPGRDQDRKRCCSHSVGKGACGRQRYAQGESVYWIGCFGFNVSECADNMPGENLGIRLRTY